ncbi:Mediator of RNA polymerase II transcription subunit 25, partial [Mucuna pruriens]
MYNANSGFNVQYIDWTTDVDHFLSTLWCLAFDGDNVSQHTIAEGLTNSIVMFPRPSSRMTMQEYYQGERHCILVATGDPIARKMLVALPMIVEGKFVEAQFKHLYADFLEVARMFRPVISWNSSFFFLNYSLLLFILTMSMLLHAARGNPFHNYSKPTSNVYRDFQFGKSLSLTLIGNSDSPTVNTPVIDYQIDQFTVLLSRNFKEVHNVLYGKGKESVESMNTTLNVALPIICTDDDVLFSVRSMTVGEQSIEGVQNESVSTLSPIIPQAITDEMDVPFPNYSLPTDANDDIMAQIDNEKNDIFLPIFEDDFMAQLDNDNDIFLPTFEDDIMAQIDNDNDIFLPILGEDTLNNNEALQEWEDDLRQVLTDIPTAGEGSSSRGLPQEMGVMNPILCSEDCSNSSSPLPQNNQNLWLGGPSDMNSTTVRLGTMDPSPIGASFGNSMFPDTTTTNSPTQSQSQSFPVLPYGSNSSSDQQFSRYQMTMLSPLGTPAMMAQYNQSHFWPCPPSLTDFQDFVHAWEGSLVGKIYSNRSSLNLAKALRIPTSPATLTVKWSSSLEIAFFLPKKAVNHTTRICAGVIHYMFFRIVQFNNLDLFDHMMSKNLCAKIDLPSQTLILSTTESKHHYLGTVFPG